MIRKKSIMAAALAAVLACQTFPAFGGAAPDGKTLAQDTEAAQGGAYDAWKERWKELSGDWTQVSITPGADETQMNFAWYSRKGEDAGFRYGKQADLSDGTDAEVKSTDVQEGYQSNKVTLTGWSRALSITTRQAEKRSAGWRQGIRIPSASSLWETRRSAPPMRKRPKSQRTF